MKFKKGDRVEVIWRSELYRGAVTQVVEVTNEIVVKLAKKPAIDYLFKQNQVSKVELVEVPKLVADWIEKKKENGDDLLVALDKNWQGMEDSVRDWFDGEKERYELFARAWLDGYEVEKEPLYYVQLITIFLGYLNERNDGRRSLSDSVQNDIFKTQFTEAEIKEMDERYWQFAVLVEEVEGEA
ncbi:DUF1642 domain-containing protein [Listeria monocytogenes]|uniref:DUF1642 domain-containing protein n=1 Tax=Listeria monocytogenes TaxID=1639 RepID=UPI0010DA7569|nr:DUF1642 domain-containing protein [Listeria monocytogenes]EAD4886463.1 DUF1642 domain-containing protein [Listeria monocytogenes]EED2280742.1 DUF1642 domain-containing protein [Listeria monocytogenes]EIC6076446.1 DUF1642 domain-containing protein [Listeria monocytogenes]EIM2501445.1 DUF1642 domain-containing protein [Listeria monocytogenes]EJE4628916.1 DUF1642 domain-containing protein [Listeria monocytogenes]